MSDPTQSPPSSRPGSPSDRKMAAATVATASGGAAVLAASILWALGCLKGHQFYMPDDALVLGWSAGIAPTLYAVKLKLDQKFGIDA